MNPPISDAVRKLFADDFKELTPVDSRWMHRIDWSVFRKRWFLWLVVVFVLLETYFCIYYYNQFVDLETNLLTQQAQIDAQLQMRKDMLTSLAGTVRDYAVHEQDMFRYMADVRGDSFGRNQTPQPGQTPSVADGAPAAAAGNAITLPDIEQLRNKIPDGLLNRLIGLAENYPELRLSDNFQNLMQSLTEVEKSLFEQRMAYNEACNIYGTYIRKFPQNLFAYCYGFETYPFFEIEDDVKVFNPNDY